jgi:hypothetical protein
MALIVKDRVLETCSTSGLVDFTLTGAVTGYQRLSAIGNGNTTYYAAYVIGSNDWEVGIGTVGTSSLTRDTILSSSTGSKVNFAGNPVVWCDLPSSKAIFGDANNNISVNSIFEGFTSVTASGTQIVLTASSTPYYLVTGSGGQTIKLPDATTLPLGAVFDFNNNQSSGAITVNNNSNTLVASIPSGGYTSVILTNNSTAAGTWDRHDQAPSNVSWSTNTFDYPGSITSATWNGSTVAVNRGGTGLSSTPANGQLDIGNGTGFTRATLTAGTNIAISNTAGAITISTTGTAAGVDQTDIGTRANQIPLNQYLGTMAYQDAKAVRLGGDAVINTLTVGLGSGSVATNTALGYQAGNSNTTGFQSVYLGYQAGFSTTTSSGVAATFVGYKAGYSQTTGYNDAFGWGALQNVTTGNSNAAFGYSSLNLATSNGNAGFGFNSLGKATSGGFNSALGASVLSKVTTGSYNTAIGYNAGATGTNDLTTGANNTLIGANTQASSATVSNEITIGNSTQTVVRFPLNYSTVASLPSASTVGRGSRTFVTDALAPTFQATIVGGGAVFTPCYSDGSVWRVG